ncbi:MAG: DUF2797 domain-containing protein [Pseudomonadales bacterium]|nr:DUF2797 domain-containing protein [Pseudomonadales bacterium]MBO7006363.1 DUF2797 domain-containing protein [Pseudomonadales bacterium]
MRGFLRKMASEVPEGGCTPDNPVQYLLKLDDDAHPLNPLIGQQVTLTHTGNIQCLECGRKTKKSYSQGFCYPCFKKLAQCDLCVVSPERCHYDQGTCRDDEFAKNFCMQPHIVYIANSSGTKVGITRPENLPTRWIDQGAVQALPVMRVMTRQQSGFVEVAFKNHISDKTQWQQMLKAENRHVDMIERRDQLMGDIKADLEPVIERFGIQAIQPILDAEVQTFCYPMTRYPTKVSSLSFDKTPDVGGTLIGIKGQYLVFDTGVINLRRFTSYEMEVTVSEAPVAGDAEEQLSLL